VATKNRPEPTRRLSAPFGSRPPRCGQFAEPQAAKAPSSKWMNVLCCPSRHRGPQHAVALGMRCYPGQTGRVRPTVDAVQHAGRHGDFQLVSRPQRQLALHQRPVRGTSGRRRRSHVRRPPSSIISVPAALFRPPTRSACRRCGPGPDRCRRELPLEPTPRDLCQAPAAGAVGLRGGRRGGPAPPAALMASASNSVKRLICIAFFDLLMTRPTSRLVILRTSSRWQSLSPAKGVART